MPATLRLLALVPLLLVGCDGGAEEPPANTPVETAAPAERQGDPQVNLVQLTDETLEVGCGMCIYQMDNVKGCRAAAVVQGTPVVVTGGGADRHAHAFCSGSSTAVVSGTVVDGVLQATKFEVVDEPAGG